MPDPSDPAAIAREAGLQVENIKNMDSDDARAVRAIIESAILSAIAPIVAERDAARAEVEKLHGLLDECQSFVICYCVGYAIQYRISADGSTLHPVHKEIVDRLAAALTTPPAGAKP